MIIVSVLMLSLTANAEETLTEEPGAAAYHFSSSYRIEIAASAGHVWPHLIDYGAWMYDFEMSVHIGQAGEIGEVRRLYPGQDFFIQTIGMVPNENLVIANLPSEFRGEHSTGVGVISLVESGGKTIVTLTMARRYEASGEGAEAMKQMRSSQAFEGGTRETWNRFLGRLKDLAEAQ
jgi:hypothetical protein